MSAAKINGKDRRRKIRALIARDGSMCCLCGGHIDMDAPHNTKGRASLEHVLARCEGRHERSLEPEAGAPRLQ